MSQRTVRISRRKLLQLSSVAPIAALLARGGSAQDCVSMPLKLPDTAASDLYAKAIIKFPKIDECLFKAVAKMLWEFLEVGAEARGLKIQDDNDIRRALANSAYVQLNRDALQAGDLISSSIANWDQGPMPNWKYVQSATLGCAYLCGFYSAEAAIFAETEIDSDAYTLGYRRTEQQMTQVLERCGQKKVCDSPMKMLAAGC